MLHRELASLPLCAVSRWLSNAPPKSASFAFWFSFCKLYTVSLLPVYLLRRSEGKETVEFACNMNSQCPEPGLPKTAVLSEISEDFTVMSSKQCLG